MEKSVLDQNQEQTPPLMLIYPDPSKYSCKYSGFLGKIEAYAKW